MQEFVRCLDLALTNKKVISDDAQAPSEKVVRLLVHVGYVIYLPCHEKLFVPLMIYYLVFVFLAY